MNNGQVGTTRTKAARLFRWAPFLAIASAGLILSACASSVAPLPSPPKVSVLPTSSSVPDYSGITLQDVPGTTIVDRNPAVQGGTASISGIIKVGGAPAGGAVIHLERFVDNKSQSLDVRAGEDGSYRAAGIQGGRYRVRAFRAPDAFSQQAEVFFLGGNDNRNLDLNLTSTGGRTAVNWGIAPNPPILGRSANVVVSISQSSVGTDGVARNSGVSNVVLRLDSDGGRPIASSNVAVTDGSGRATWQVRCDSQDNQGLTLTFADGRTQRLDVAGCQNPPTTTSSSSTSAAPGEEADE